jgi:hypothetical protein
MVRSLKGRRGIAATACALTLLATAGAVVVATPASAAVVDSTDVLTRTYEIPPYGKKDPREIDKPILVITPQLVGGKRYYVEGRWTVRTDHDQATMQGLYLRCHGASSFEAKSVYTTGNVVKDVSQTATARVRFALVAPATGTYNCALMGYALRLDVGTSARKFTTVEGAANTYLFTNTSSLTDLAEWKNDDTTEMSEPGAVAHVMRRTLDTRSDTKTLRVHVDLEGTGLRVLPLKATRYQVVLYVTQLTAGGAACSAPVSTTTKNVTIHPDVVHLKSHLKADVPILAGGAHADCAPKFGIKTRVNYQGGMKLRIEGPLYSNTVAWSYGVR